MGLLYAHTVLHAHSANCGFMANSETYSQFAYFHSTEIRVFLELNVFVLDLVNVVHR